MFIFLMVVGWFSRSMRIVVCPYTKQRRLSELLNPSLPNLLKDLKDLEDEGKIRVKAVIILKKGYTVIATKKEA